MTSRLTCNCHAIVTTALEYQKIFQLKQSQTTIRISLNINLKNVSLRVLLIIKVCITDINEESGQQVQKELAQEYSEDAVIFAKCDVTSKDQLEGVKAKYYSYFCILQLKKSITT